MSGREDKEGVREGEREDDADKATTKSLAKHTIICLQRQGNKDVIDTTSSYDCKHATERSKKSVLVPPDHASSLALKGALSVLCPCTGGSGGARRYLLAPKICHA